MARWLDLYCRALDALTAAMLAAMVLLVFGNVVLRYVFNSGITVSEELGRWLFVWLTFLGAIATLKDHGHLGTDMLTSRLGATGRRVCVVASQLAMIAIGALLLHGSWAQTRINADVEAPVSGLPMAVVYAAGIVFGLSAVVIVGWQLRRTLSGAPEEAHGVVHEA